MTIVFKKTFLIIYFYLQSQYRPRIQKYLSLLIRKPINEPDPVGIKIYPKYIYYIHMNVLNCAARLSLSISTYYYSHWPHS